MSSIQSLSIRSAKVKDLPHLVNLLAYSAEARPYLFHFINPQAQLRILRLRYTFEKYLDRIRRFFVSLSPRELVTSSADRAILVAEHQGDNKIVGAMFLSNIGSGIWSLDILVTHPNYREIGVGAALLREGTDLIKAANGKRLLVSVIEGSRAEAFYLNRGFTVTYRLAELELGL